MRIRLCSACLLGIPCTLNGTNNKNDKVLKLSKQEILIPVCPEQLGGLPTPREASELTDTGENVINGRAKVVSKSGKDVTENFIIGAQNTLEIAKLYGIKEAILKQRSPSCGCGTIYDGTFTRNKRSGNGITSALLKQNGFSVMSEEDI